MVCTPFDGAATGTPVEDTITIANSPPTAPVVDVTPNAPSTDDDLVCAVTTPSTDADGDGVTYSYAWYKDTVLQPALTTDTVDSSNTADGEVWRCAVTPYDGIDYGAPGEDEVTIGAPVLSGGTVAPVSGYTATTFTYSVVYTDGDNDAPTAITVTIDAGTPQDMTVRAGEDGDYTNGEAYEYTTTGLVEDVSHTFKFAASDGTNDATGDTGVHNGPTVSPKPSGGGGGFAAPDRNPPRIYDVTLGEVTKTTADIHWKTKEKSDSQVEYRASPSLFSELAEEMVFTHLVQLTGLTPATTYYYKAMSRDRAGNLEASEEFTFTTPGLPARITTRNLSVSPAEVDIGQSVTISVAVANTGDAEGTYEVILKIDGAVVDTEEVTLGGGASQTVTFTVARDTAGSFSASVDGLTGKFVVREAAPPTPAPLPLPAQEEPPAPETPANWWLIGGIIAAVVVAGSAVYFFFIRRRKTA